MYQHVRLKVTLRYRSIITQVTFETLFTFVRLQMNLETEEVLERSLLNWENSHLEGVPIRE